jgi:hypothetical protein
MLSILIIFARKLDIIMAITLLKRNKILTFACRGEYDLVGHDFFDVSSTAETSTACGRQTLTVLDSH